jgi:type I restriction enzyme R subunit
LEVLTTGNYNANQIRFLRAVQSVFLQKRHLETADTSTLLSASLYEPPLDMFGADAVERWFNKKEIQDLIEFSNRLIA